MKSADFFSPWQKQSSSRVTETPWRPGTPAPLNRCDQLEGQQLSFKVLCIVKLVFYHCRNHNSFNFKAVHTCKLYQTLLLMVQQDAPAATRVISELPSGEFLVKMKVLLRFVLYVGDDNGVVSTGNEWRHSSLPAPGRTPRLEGGPSLQQRGGGGRVRQVLVEQGKLEGSRHVD